MQFLRKTSAIALALAILAASSCGGGSAQTETTTSAETATETTAGEPAYAPTVYDFGGETLNMFLWETPQGLVIESETGDVVNDAIFRRNSKVMDEFNVDIKFTVQPGSGDNYSSWINVVSSSVMAGDGEIDLVGGYGHMIMKDVSGETFHNLADIASMDLPPRPLQPCRQQ